MWVHPQKQRLGTGKLMKPRYKASPPEAVVDKSTPQKAQEASKPPKDMCQNVRIALWVFVVEFRESVSRILHDRLFEPRIREPQKWAACL